MTADRRILVTGGAGFIGATLCVALASRHSDWDVVAFDNLKRRGSELNLPRLRSAGVRFTHGDVRQPSDLADVGRVDALVEASAEPSALAGVSGATEYLVHSNLIGAYNCLEVARRHHAQVVFLSTSRVYPYPALDALPFQETDTRFELLGSAAAGVAEDFSLEGPRTLYGATKLAAEHLVTEYGVVTNIPVVVNRCGVIAGPWQMGKVDQGVFTYWALAHVLARPLSYIGYGGKGKQVRDLLHIDDLVELLEEQLCDPDGWAGEVVNVGGGRPMSLSLKETTGLLADITGRVVPVRESHDFRPGDVRVYISDCSRLFARTDWRPRRTPGTVLAETVAWIEQHQDIVLAALD